MVARRLILDLKFRYDPLCTRVSVVFLIFAPSNSLCTVNELEIDDDCYSLETIKDAIVDLKTFKLDQEIINSNAGHAIDDLQEFDKTQEGLNKAGFQFNFWL